MKFLIAILALTTITSLAQATTTLESSCAAQKHIAMHSKDKDLFGTTPINGYYNFDKIFSSVGSCLISRNHNYTELHFKNNGVIVDSESILLTEESMKSDTLKIAKMFKNFRNALLNCECSTIK